MRACPFYRNGFCVSPLLGSPADYVTDSSRCLGNYTTCRYYPDTPDLPDEQGGKKRIVMYTPVNILSEEVYSECKYFRLVRTTKGIVAKCLVMDRILTRSQALLCSKHWNTCPIREEIQES